MQRVKYSVSKCNRLYVRIHHRRTSFVNFYPYDGMLVWY